MSGTWKPRSLTGGATSPVNEINSVFAKISSKNYVPLRDKMLTITILEDPETEEAISSPGVEIRDTELMKPVVDAFMRNLKLLNDNSPVIEIYTNMFIDMKKGWKGRHGKILEKLFNRELEISIREYTKKEEKEVKDNLEIYTLAKFIGLLYDKGEVPGLYVMKVLEIFYGTNINSLNVVARLLRVIISKLKTDPFFKAKLEKKYRTLLDSQMHSHGGSLKFLIEDVFKEW